MIRKTAICSLLIVGFLAGCFVVYGNHLRKRTLFLANAALDLSDQKQAPTVNDLRQRFGKELQKSDDCTQSDCTYEIEVSNRPLAALAVFSYTEMKAYFWTRDGQLLGSMVDYTTTVDRQYTVVSHVQLDICDTCSAFAIHPWGNSSSLDTNGIVEIGNTVSAQDRRAVLSFDSNCMTRLGGCKSIADLLPSVWQKTSAGTIACKIPNDRGSASKCNTL